jgi:excinuclease UvrABC nuclease subunit
VKTKSNGESAKDLDFMQAAKLRDDIKITRTVKLRSSLKFSIINLLE